MRKKKWFAFFVTQLMIANIFHDCVFFKLAHEIRQSLDLQNLQHNHHAIKSALMSHEDGLRQRTKSFMILLVIIKLVFNQRQTKQYQCAHMFKGGFNIQNLYL